MGYRDADQVLRARLARHGARLRELDQAPVSLRRLPRRLRSELDALRRQAEASDGGVGALQRAEAATDAYEQRLDEALGLGAELNKWVAPPWPRRAVVMRWSALAGLSIALLTIGIHQLGMTAFVLRALGIQVTPPVTAYDLPDDIEPCRDRIEGAAAASIQSRSESERELLDRIVQQQGARTP